MTDPVHIIYHPAPGPGVDGNIVEIAPIDLGADTEFALEWIRRRLGLPRGTDTEILRFRNEIVDIPVVDVASRQPAAATSAETLIGGVGLGEELVDDPGLRDFVTSGLETAMGDVPDFPDFATDDSPPDDQVA